MHATTTQSHAPHPTTPQTRHKHPTPHQHHHLMTMQISQVMCLQARPPPPTHSQSYKSGGSYCRKTYKQLIEAEANDDIYSKRSLFIHLFFFYLIYKYIHSSVFITTRHRLLDFVSLSVAVHCPCLPGARLQVLNVFYGRHGRVVRWWGAADKA